MSELRFLLLLCALPVAAVAHDFWFEPSSFTPAPGQRVEFRLRIGDDFVGEKYPRDEELLDQFVLAGPPGWQNVAGNNGDEPAGHATAGDAGLYLAGYRSKPMFIELEAAKFEQYLWKEGLEHAIRSRHAHGENARPGRELFSRCAKALLVSGAGATNGYDRALGFRLEIIPAKNPLALAAGDTLPVTVSFEAKPISNLLVTAISTNNPTRRIQGRTDASGRVDLKLPERSTWLVKTVHIFPAADPKRADWESLWATYIFSQP